MIRQMYSMIRKQQEHEYQVNKKYQLSYIFILVMRNSNPSIILEDNQRQNWNQYKYTKVMERISLLQNEAEKNLDKYTKQYLLGRFNEELNALKESHQTELDTGKDELNVWKEKFQKERSQLVKLKKQQNDIKNLQRIKQLTEAIQKMNDDTRKAEGRMQQLKDQTISRVTTTLELKTQFEQEKQSLLKANKELNDKCIALSRCLQEQQKKAVEKKKVESRLEENIRTLASKIGQTEEQLSKQKQSRITQEIRLQKDYNRYKEELKDTYDRIKDEKYERKIREREQELSKNKTQFDKAKLNLTKEKIRAQELESKIAYLNKDLKKQQDRVKNLNIQIQDNRQIIAQFQKTSQEFTKQNQQRQSHIKEIRHLQKKYSSQVEGVESNLKRNYQDLFKRLKEDYQSTKNKVVNDLKAEIKQQRDKYAALQQTMNKIEQKHRQDIQLYDVANASLEGLVDERVEDIKAIAKTFLGTRPKDNDFSKIKESFEIKYNQLVAKLDLLKLNEESFKRKEQSWQKQLQELNRWLRNTSNLLKSQQVEDIFLKAKKYSANDKELRDVLNKFTENLHGRLRKDKEEVASKESQISQLKRQQQNDTQKHQAQYKKMQEGIASNESQLIRLRFLYRQLQRQKKEDEQKNSKVIGQLKKKVEDSERQIQDYIEQLAKISDSSESLKEFIDNYENTTIPALEKRIAEQTSKNKKYDEKLTSLSKNIQALQMNKRLLTSEKEKLAEQNASYISEIQRMRDESQYKENKHADQLKRLTQAIQQSYSVQFSSSSFQPVLEAIKNNKSSKPLATSVILQRFNAERNTINALISNFLKDPNFKAKFLFRYDEFHKKFQSYLPIKESFDFIVICRIKEVIFGVISKGLGANSQALLFNANTGKSFTGDIKTASSNYDGGNLLFGNGEIRFKNNTNMQFVVNVRIFGTKYFNFKKEEVVGKEEAPVLDELEIYRIDH